MTSAPSTSAATIRAALIGNPNTGKTTLFNRLCGLRHKTSNFPGTTQEARIGRVRMQAGGPDVELIDLPGVYSLELQQTEAELCRRVLGGSLGVPGSPATAPDVVCVIMDASNLGRNLLLAGEALRRRLPTVVAVNMIDIAHKRGLRVDAAVLRDCLGCEVVVCNARSGEGADELAAALGRASIPNRTPPGTQDRLEAWADEVFAAAASSPPDAHLHADTLTDRLDRVFTHPILGMFVFGATMFAVFYAIFSLAQAPMGLIETIFGYLASAVRDALPPGVLGEFLSDGVVNGIGSTVVFLPQICLLFFLISLLEDTGYLARGAFMMNRLLRPFGLSGHAFVPLLSSHACALPGIMSCRGIPDRRERLAAIMAAPFMTCSARIPVYVLLTTILFPGSPMRQSIAFAACYVLGVLAGLLSSLIARRTLLRGPQRDMAMELPSYKVPSLRTAVMTMWDRGIVFLKKAGTNILAICIVLWWLSTYPHVDPPVQATELRATVANLADEDLVPVVVTSDAIGDPTTRTAADVRAEADRIESRHALAQSFAGRLGKAVQPVFAPLDFDWQLSVGVLTSFAAREVFVSTMAVVTTGSDDTEDEGVLTAIAQAKRDDGVTPIFTPSVSWALLVYYVLAMQCLPTLAVTAREAGGMRWALLQLGWMTAVAYGGALLARYICLAAGIV